DVGQPRARFAGCAPADGRVRNRVAARPRHGGARAQVEHLSRPWLEWGMASSPRAEGDESGDRHVIAFYPGGVILGVFDGLGHGPEAARAAEAAALTIEEHASDDLGDLLARCHAALRDTRGVVMCIVCLHLETSEIEWLGVGDVEGVVAT